MAARALQSISITFGLVTIPVKVYAATNPSAGVSFNLLHRCGSRVRQQYRCIAEDRDVPRDELVKGYQFEKDQFVTFTKEELDALDAEATGAVEITEFVDATSVDPVFYEKAYYLGPDKGGAKPYALLAEAMRRSGRTAIGRWAARGKQYLVQLRVTDDGLVMQQLLYADEVRAMKDLEVGSAPVNPRELDLADQLIDSITSAEGFDAAKYHDEVQERIQQQIQRKIEGKEITAPEAPVTSEGAKVIDLVEALRASLRERAGGGAAKPARPDREGAERAADKVARATGRAAGKPAERVSEAAAGKGADAADRRRKPARAEPADKAAASAMRPAMPAERKPAPAKVAKKARKAA